jgi:hypothetical protein
MSSYRKSLSYRPTTESQDKIVYYVDLMILYIVCRLSIVYAVFGLPVIVNCRRHVPDMVFRRGTGR